MAHTDQRSPQAEAYRRLYHTARWRRTRAAQLRKQPLCEACLKRGRYAPATVCNHADPATKATAFFAGPFTSLCAPCHDAGEQKAERAGFTGEADEDGWPTDARHPANRRRE
jgi:5-methylcytosine-specific restriction protein A